MTPQPYRPTPQAWTAALDTCAGPAASRCCWARLGRIGGAHTTADDVAQEVCLAVLKALPRYREQGRPFSAFVFAVAAHKVADAQRAAVRISAVTDTPPERPDAAPKPEEQAVAKDLTRRLSVLLHRLPNVQREIITLRVAVVLTAEEVGTILDMSAPAVRVAQSQALARLRALASDGLHEVAA